MTAATLHQIDCLNAQQTETLQQWFNRSGAFYQSGTTKLFVNLEPQQVTGLQQDYGLTARPVVRL